MVAGGRAFAGAFTGVLARAATLRRLSGAGGGLLPAPAAVSSEDGAVCCHFVIGNLAASDH